MAERARALVALDGQPTCDGVSDPQTMCPRVRDTLNSGAAALAVGGAALVTGAILIGVSARRRGSEPRLAITLPASGR